MKSAVSLRFKGLAASAVTALLVSGVVLADSDADILERIKPIGKVTTDAPAPAAAPAAATPAPAAPAAAAEPAAAAAAAPAAAPADTEASAPAAAGDDVKALATAKGCLACHQIDVKVVGPAYKDVAAKYKGDDGAFDMLVEKVKNGGSGTWGPIPMPPNSATTSDEEIQTLVKWVLSM